MSEPENQPDTSVACDFLDLYLDDLDAGRARSLQDYQNRFPGHEREIAQQYAALVAQAQPSGTADTAGTRQPDGLVVADRYRLIEVLGRGGQGTVHLAEDLRLQRRVALKLLGTGVLTANRVARLRREAEAIARLDHPRLCAILDADLDGPQPYIAMRCIDGESLAERIRTATQADTATDPGRLLTRLPQTNTEIHTVLLYIEQAARALHAAHESGLIHRDVKPANLMVDTHGAPVLLDFGLAREEESSSLLTQSGDLFGTLAYMSPEQLAGADALDRRTDVYSLGLTLYECLALRRPFGQLDSESLSRRIHDGTVPDPVQFNPALDRETRVVVGRALERDRDRRYPTALEFAEDLRRIRQYEPIQARPANAALRLRRWARRHPTIAATTILAFVSLTTLLIVVSTAHNRTLRDAAELNQLNRKFDMLAYVVRLQAAEESAAVFAEGATRPERIGELQTWLDESAKPLLAALPKLRAAIAELRLRAEPLTPAERANQEQTHPRLPELQRLRTELAALQRAQAVRDGRAKPPAYGIDDATRELLQLHRPAWNKRAWQIVNARKPQWDRVGEGLALARALQEGPPPQSWQLRAEIGNTLAWALFRNGLDAEASATSARARTEVPPHADVDAWIQDLSLAMNGLDQYTARLHTRVADLERIVRERHSWRFSQELGGLLHDRLPTLIADLERFQTTTVRRARRDLQWARRVGQLTIEDQQPAWQRARAAILEANGSTASALYGPGRLDLTPHRGLIPIGMNPITKLWEFYHPRSAAPGTPTPSHAADGRIEVSADTGIVFVLLPGGRAWLGSQPTDPARPNFDPKSENDEWPRTVELEPFFLARHELTQAQFERLSDDANPSRFQPGFIAGGRIAGATHPVDTVSWSTCRAVLRRHSLELPKESDWEYACRAGTVTPWSTGSLPASLEGSANIFDESLQAFAPNTVGIAIFDDGYAITAPVATYAANAFGLHDMHGNLLEWCEEPFSPFVASRVARGGSWRQPATSARASDRISRAPQTKGDDLGVRAARRLER